MTSDKYTSTVKRVFNTVMNAFSTLHHLSWWMLATILQMLKANLWMLGDAKMERGAVGSWQMLAAILLMPSAVG